jgi:hypothetical protein
MANKHIPPWEPVANCDFKFTTSCSVRTNAKGGEEGYAECIQHHSTSADFFIIASGNDMLVFDLAEAIFFHGKVIRDIDEKGLHVFDASAGRSPRDVVEFCHLFFTSETSFPLTFQSLPTSRKAHSA